MKKFEIKVYEIEEAFINSLMYAQEEEFKNEAVQAFAEMIHQDETSRLNYMFDYLKHHDEFYIPIPDGLREYLGLDAGCYYLEEGWAM
jgi:hypothetical protein